MDDLKTRVNLSSILKKLSSFEFPSDDGLSPDHFESYVNELEPELRNMRELFIVTDEFNYGPYEHNPSEYNPSLSAPELQSMAMDSGYRAPANVGHTMENTSSTLALHLLDAMQLSMYPSLSQSALPFISPQHTSMPSAEPETNHQGPGGNTTTRVAVEHIITPEEAKIFTVDGVFLERPSWIDFEYEY
ncbi:hypothetical protein EW146_g10327 [Bondarzewia mesenterica]|uniref:Uncharacterized protein n=1 Tax=Bondarzewia mesenterica TaxID=1095465 RepID=A0A4S4KYS5_9AGAM|nr:hypothetical protein EW146_g10327 [Bondarzewia mesenterica]